MPEVLAQPKWGQQQYQALSEGGGNLLRPLDL